MIYVKDGMVNHDSFYLEQYRGSGPCQKHPATQWQIRRADAGDFVGTGYDGSSVTELHGTVMMCIESDVVLSAFTAQSPVDFKPMQPEMQNCDKIELPVSSVADAQADKVPCEATLRVNLFVPKCTSPLTARTAARIARGLPEDYPEDDEAKEIFRFDDVATPLADDYSMGPCECLFPGYGDKWPVDMEVQKKIPGGSMGIFVPQSQLLISGSATCEVQGLKKTITDLSAEDCAFAAKKHDAHFYVQGELSGLVLCRLYETCDAPILEHGAESFVYGVFYDTMCAVANPRKCWGLEKRRQFLTGYRTKVQPGQDKVTFSGAVPCAFQSVLIRATVSGSWVSVTSPIVACASMRRLASCPSAGH
jgi:hypothetical protein